MIRFNLKALRSSHNNMSQKELIEKTQIRPSTLSAFENSTAKTISIEQIDKLCEIFNCQPSDIMTYIPDATSDYINKVTNNKSLADYYQQSLYTYLEEISKLNARVQYLEDENRILLNSKR